MTDQPPIQISEGLPICQHQFFELDEAKEYGIRVYGIHVMCANCGEWRLMQFDGKLMRFEREEKVWREIK